MQEHDDRRIRVPCINKMNPEIRSIDAGRDRDEPATTRIVGDAAQDLSSCCIRGAKDLHQNRTLLVSVSERAMSSSAGAAITT